MRLEEKKVKVLDEFLNKKGSPILHLVEILCSAASVEAEIIEVYLSCSIPIFPFQAANFQAFETGIVAKMRSNKIRLREMR